MLTLSEISKRIAGLSVQWTTLDPISTQNGAPSGDVGALLDPSPVFALYTVEPPAGIPVDFRIWYKYQGRTDWHHVIGAEETAISVNSTEEIKARVVERVYFERLDAGGGNCGFSIGILL